MQGTIIENLSGRKLFILVVLLIIGQIISFLVGGLIGEYGQVHFCKDFINEND